MDGITQRGYHRVAILLSKAYVLLRRVQCKWIGSFAAAVWRRVMLSGDGIVRTSSFCSGRWRMRCQ